MSSNGAESTAPRRSTRKRKTESPLNPSPPKVAKVAKPRPHRCPICPLDYVNAQGLQNHIAKKHPETLGKSEETAILVDVEGVAPPEPKVGRVGSAPRFQSTAGAAAGERRAIPIIDLADSPPPSATQPYDSKGKGKGKGKVAKRAAFSPPKPLGQEKRPKRFRTHAPSNVQDRLYRCQTQKMYVLDRSGNARHPLEETFQMAGSTGNVYTVTICDVPYCNCPDGERNGTCKHILYIMSKVLRARSDLVYQAGLLRSELEHIFTHAPPPPSSSASTRKPLDADDCPVCYCGFGPGDRTVYCKAQCGTNLHAACFEQWAATKGAGRVTCVMCREPWQGDEEGAKELLKSGKLEVGPDGYVNVASQLGISGQRDHSTYHNPSEFSSWAYGGRRRRYW